HFAVYRAEREQGLGRGRTPGPEGRQDHDVRGGQGDHDRHAPAVHARVRGDQAGRVHTHPEGRWQGRLDPEGGGEGRPGREDGRVIAPGGGATVSSPVVLHPPVPSRSPLAFASEPASPVGVSVVVYHSRTARREVLAV